MHMPRISVIATTLVLLVAAPASFAHAPQNGSTAASMAAVKNFKLNDAFLDKYFAIGKDTAKDPCNLSYAPILAHRDGHRTLAAMAAKYDAKPGVHQMLASHDITAKKFLTGVAVLMGAAMQEAAQNHPGLKSQASGGMKISSANMAYFKAHKSEIMQHMMKLGQETRQANGGKMPACLAGH